MAPKAGLPQQRPGTTGTADRPFAHPAELRYVLPVDATAWAALGTFCHRLFRRSRAGGQQSGRTRSSRHGNCPAIDRRQIDQSPVGPEQQRHWRQLALQFGPVGQPAAQERGPPSTLSSLATAVPVARRVAQAPLEQVFRQRKLHWRPFRQPNPRQHAVQTPVAERTARKQQRREWQPGQSRRRRHHRRPDPCAGRPVPQRLRGRGQSRDRLDTDTSDGKPFTVLDWTRSRANGVAEHDGAGRSAQPSPSGGLLAWWLGELREVAVPLAAADATASDPRAPARAAVLARSRAARAAAGAGRQPLAAGNRWREPAGGRAPAAPDAGPQSGCDRPGAGRAGCAHLRDLCPRRPRAISPRSWRTRSTFLTPWSAELGYAPQKIMARRRDGMLEVLVAAAARADLDRVLHQLAAVGVKPASVDVAIDKEPGAVPGSTCCTAQCPNPDGVAGWCWRSRRRWSSPWPAPAWPAGRSISGKPGWPNRRP